MKTMLYFFLLFLWMVSIFVIMATGTQLKAIYSYVRYYDDFLNTISRDRFNSLETNRTFFSGAVRMVDTVQWISPYKKEKCVIAHTAMMAEIYCSRCDDRNTMLLNQVKGRAFWVEGAQRRIFVPNTLSLLRFTIDGDHFLQGPLLNEMPNEISQLVVRKVSLGQREDVRGYRVSETAVKEGDSICLNVFLDREDRIVGTEKSKLIMLGGFGEIRNRLLAKRLERQTEFNDQLVWVILSCIWFLIGLIVWGYDYVKRNMLIKN